jgi:predicted AAA+ superfamily ATPase
MEKSIKRSILKEIVEHLASKEITMIVGARQVGKTTLMRDLLTRTEQAGKRSMFFNLDVESDAAFFVSQQTFLDRLRLEFGDQEGVVFIDEIQRKTDAGIFLKGLYDLNLPYKLVVSGSGSLELKEKIHESLAGRKRLFEMLPVTFLELVDFRTDYKYSEKLPDFFTLHIEKTRKLLKEYLNFGGYPRVVLALEQSEKEKIIHEIFRSYAEKDISYFLRIDRVEAFESVLKLLASQTGRIIEYASLSREASISFVTLKKYLWYAEKTFAIHLTLPYFKNRHKELVKAPIAYFNDLGLRNELLGYFGNLPEQEYGFIFQNLVENALLENTRWKNTRLKFWRTTDGREVDFILDKGNAVIPVEVKYAALVTPNIEKSLRVFLERYEPKEALVVNLTLDEKRTFGKTAVRFIPFWKLWFLE